PATWPQCTYIPLLDQSTQSFYPLINTRHLFSSSHLQPFYLNPPRKAKPPKHPSSPLPLAESPISLPHPTKSQNAHRHGHYHGELWTPARSS
uniref:Uncharacterized protein n=1 Tax=Aegilops tauschii subsp. strangulata TaxID=200361 RepID=A0A453KA64_AEGTS